jgi:hypothetical protein
VEKWIGAFEFFAGKSMHRCAGLILIAAVFCSSSARAQPAIIPRLATVPQVPRRTFERVKDYFSNPENGNFTILRADSGHLMVVARRNGIDSQSWNDWTFCKLPPDQMLDALEDGTVTLTVRIDGAGDNSSYVSVVANFKGTNELAGKQNTSQCVSKGILENQILKALGGAPETS